jgi:ABC-type transport system involved in multi-copper enzyme maturation permease subunit
LDFELSQPISRTKYLAGHILVGLFYSLALVFFQTIIIWILCNAYNISIKDDGLIAFGILAIFFVWAIFGIAVLFTSIFRSKIAVTLVTVVLTLGFYLFTSLTNLIDRLKDYEKISLFYLYSPQKALETGNLNINYLIILAAILIICTALSLLIFNKKDV